MKHILAIISLSLLPLLALAQDAIAWSRLSENQRQLLAPLQKNWDQLPPLRQRAILHGAERWQKLTPEQRQQAQQRLRDWQQLSAEQKKQIRDRFDRFRDLDPGQRQAIQQRFQDFQNLPEPRRRQLREQFQSRPPGAFPGDTPNKPSGRPPRLPRALPPPPDDNAAGPTEQPSR